MYVAEQAQGSDLNSKMLASQAIATCGRLAAAQLVRRSGRQPGLTGAAQHPGIGRAVIPTAFNSMTKQPATTRPACNDPWFVRTKKLRAV
jgi:hypothetical protein